MNKKITFLMAAHNEGKIIHLALDKLKQVKKDYPNMEAIIGLDGCTDNTKKVVEKYSFVRIIELNLRKGKQSVLDELEKYITGDIVIIHDADWKFVYKNKEKLIEFIEIFSSSKIGGVTNCFSAVFDGKRIKKIKSLGFLANAWQSYYLTSFQKKYCTKKIKGKLYIDKNRMLFPFFLDFYKRKVLDLRKRSRNLRAGDHIERTLRILNSGHEIRVIDDIDMPRFVATYEEQTIKSMVNQRMRGTIARQKIKTEYQYKVPLKFYFLFTIFFLTNLNKMNKFRDYIASFLFWIFMFYATITAPIRARKVSMEKVWGMVMKEEEKGKKK